MGDLSFGQTVGMLKDALTGSSAAQGVYANNVANVNTPNFRRSDVSFKEALAATEASDPDPEQLAMVTTDERHIPVGGAQEPEPFSVTSTVDDTQIMRQDGSNVDMDQEMAKLSLNSAYAQTMGQLLQNQYSRLRQAIETTP